MGNIVVGLNVTLFSFQPIFKKLSDFTPHPQEVQIFWHRSDILQDFLSYCHTFREERFQQ